MDDLKHFSVALTRVLEAKFQSLDLAVKDKICNEINRLHLEGLGGLADLNQDPNWGFNHRSDNLEIFAKAINMFALLGG